MTTRTEKILADLQAIDRRLEQYDAEGVGQADFPGARARAEMHELGSDLARDLAEVYADAGDEDGAAAAEVRQDDHDAASTRYRAAAEHATRHQGAPVEIVTFGYLHAPAPPADITLDLRRHFRDPHVRPELRDLTAEDAAVRDAVLSTPGVLALLSAVEDSVLAYLDGPADEPVTIAVGCAGGRHRAAAVGDALGSGLAEGYRLFVTLTHRDLDKPVVERGAEGGHVTAAQEPREIDVDPAAITRLDGREERDPTSGRVRQRMTVGTTPEGTPVVLFETPPPVDYPTGDGWPKLAETRGHKVMAYHSLAAAREDRDFQITRGYLPSDNIAEYIHDVSG